MASEIVDANASEAVTDAGMTGIAEDGEMSMGSFLEEIQKKSKERRITVGRKFICAEQLQYNAKKLLNESNASAVFADSQTSIHADNTIGQDNSIAAEMSLLSPNARALARMPEEERRKIAWERFQEHLRKQKRIHEIERIVKEKNSHLSAAELVKKLEAQLEKEIAEERANEAKAMELASNDSGMDKQMKSTGEQSVQPMEVDESTFRVPSSSASASPAPSALSAARLPHLQIAHSTPLISSRKPQFGPINVSSILIANSSNISANDTAQSVAVSKQLRSLIDSSTFDQLEEPSPGKRIFANKRQPKTTAAAASKDVPVEAKENLSASFPAPRTGRQLSSSFSRVKHTSDNLTDSMEKSIEFSVINQAADGEKTLTEGLMSMVDPVTERRPHRSTIGQARCSDAADRTPTGTPKRANITDRSLERRISVLARPKEPGSCSKQSCGHHHQRSVCPQNPSLAAKQLTPVRRVLQLNNTFGDFSLVNIPSTPSASASASTAVPPLALLHSNSPSLSAALQPLPASPAALPPSTASPKSPLNNSHHRIVHYSSSSSSSDSEDEQEEEMQNTQNGETSSSPDLFLPVADLHINDNHNDIGFDYDLSNDYPLGLNGRPSSLYTSIPQAGSRASTRATNRVGKKKNLRSSIFSTDTPGKQGPSTAGRRRDDTLWTNQSNVDVDDTNNEGDRELVGFTEVEIKEKRFVKTKTADPRLATERERQVRMQMAKMRKARKLRELMNSHKRGERLNETADSIVTSDEDN
ncbi:hypothetical protein WR25_03673 [Diploscapter pachys]|uniref:Uncharacterized protein n=1 Tax=Diploscapter pachys TaxID=2018661 RepID=A0A2A2LVU2_9BILA|nr:hypothetical protein WR25_03673 [Diploscapter pachys]